MPLKELRITSLPTRYEGLINTFGDKAKTTFVASAKDLDVAKRLIASAERASQGKLMLVEGESGSGKTTFIHSLNIFAADRISSVVRLPLSHELALADIPGYLAKLPVEAKHTIINFDGREAPDFTEPEYRTFLGALNGVLRARKDLLIFWPVTDQAFAGKVIALLEKVGGKSPFGPVPIHKLIGLDKGQFGQALEKILQIANWRLEDAAVSTKEVEELIAKSDRVGIFLDNLHGLVALRFDVGSLGIEFPTLVIAISSGEPKIRERCRALRRADSFYIEASRLLMYTKKSNVAEWWANRATDLKSALPHVIAIFNAQLISLSASSVVHSVLQYGTDDLRNAVEGVRADRGNAKRVMASSELWKFVAAEALDNREYGSSVGKQTYESYARIQKLSETKHKELNTALIESVKDAGADLPVDLAYEVAAIAGQQSDVLYTRSDGKVSLEFHHKAAEESTENKIAIYVLEKLKEYAINFGLAKR